MMFYVGFFKLLADCSVAELMNVTDEPLEEHQIAYICKKALKVLTKSVYFSIF